MQIIIIRTLIVRTSLTLETDIWNMKSEIGPKASLQTKLVEVESQLSCSNPKKDEALEKCQPNLENSAW